MTPPILDPTRRWECPSCGAQHITRDPRPVTPMHQCREHHGLDMPFAEVRAGRLELGRGTVTHRIIERGDWVGKEQGIRMVDGRAVMAVHTERADGHDTHVFAPIATATARVGDD